MIMNRCQILLLLMLIFLGCQNDEKYEALKKDILTLKESNSKLEKKLEATQIEYVLPFKIFEEIVMNEFARSPDSTVNAYKDLMVRYPKSYWNHEAKARIENIEKRRQYWTKEKGWNFNTLKKTSPTIKKPNLKEVIMERTISCPGC